MCSFRLLEELPFEDDIVVGQEVIVTDRDPQIIPVAAYASSSWLPSTGPDKAIDSDWYTFWRCDPPSTVPGAWFYIDLGSRTKILGLDVAPPGKTETPRLFRVQVSDTSTTWYTVATFYMTQYDWTRSPSYTRLPIYPLTCRYVRILVDTYNDPGSWAISEIRAIGADRIFAGTIDSIRTTYSDANNIRYLNVHCVDYNQLADRHLVAYAYETEKAGDIIKDIVSRFFVYGSESENIDVANVEDGPEIEKAVFNYIPASQCFDELANLAGKIWYIDYNKRLFFTDPSANTAPFSLSDLSENWRKMEIDRGRDQYRNRQYIRAGTARTGDRTDSVIAVAAQTLFEYPFPVGTVNGIKEDGTPKTVGVKGFDEGKDYYWTYNSEVIEAATAPGAGVDVSMNYQGLYDILLTETNYSEVASRQTIEGGTGIYESIIDDPQINSQTIATETALAYLRRFGVIPETIAFETDEPGLRSGQLLPVDIGMYDLSGNYLIESVSVRDEAGIINRYKVNAVSNESLSDWLDFFNSLSRQTQKLTLYDETKVSLLESPTDGVITSDSATETNGKPDSYTDSAHTDFSETDWI